MRAHGGAGADVGAHVREYVRYIPREGGPTFKYHFDVRINVLKMGYEPPGLEAAYCASNAIGSGDRHRTRLGPIRPSREALLAGV